MKRISIAAKLIGVTVLASAAALLGGAHAGGAFAPHPSTVLADTSWGGFAPCGPPCGK
ncbi:hypothetical protein ACFQ6N_20775 [Kitasatospora sp. NPDC056446]|uniref:hypothetical protein n=1 Tax=Kitasatospora sp. NPDC056446 TaxID=3345819 RepID=UPI0036BBDF22